MTGAVWRPHSASCPGARTVSHAQPPFYGPIGGSLARSTKALAILGRDDERLLVSNVFQAQCCSACAAAGKPVKVHTLRHDGFHRIRHYGFLDARRSCHERLPRASRLSHPRRFPLHLGIKKDSDIVVVGTAAPTPRCQ